MLPVLAGALLALRVQEDARVPGVRIEAEAFDACVPPAGAEVARRHDLPWASGRTGLIRFPAVERITWRFELPEGGTQELWLRHATPQEAAVRWSVDDEPWRTTEVAASGGSSGRGNWRWARLGTRELRAGPHELALAGAPIRPDCFWIAPAGAGEPTWPADPRAAELAPEVRAALEAGPPRAEATWLADAAALALPRWYEEARVALHTRLSVAWTDRPLFTRAAHPAAELGAPVITRHVKSVTGECFWPSSLGKVAPWVEAATEDGVDPVAAMARRAHGEGLRFVAYYRHQEDRPLARAHPDWVCVDAEGRAIRRGGEPRLCFHSPFGTATFTRFRELARRGADGLYLDESHQPLEGCWCPWTRAAFTRETGLPLPDAALLEDPLYRRFLAFTEDSLARTLWEWRRDLAAEFPGFVLLVSHHRQPCLLEPLPSLRLGTIADAVKSELRTGVDPAVEVFLDAHPGLPRPARDARLLLPWVLGRDGAFGRPAHVWIHDLADAARLRAATTAVIASGCVANLDVPEDELADPARFASAFALGRQLGAALADARPVDLVAPHVPERARPALLADPLAAWEGAIAPFLAAWELLLDVHAPAHLVGDDRLDSGRLGDARVLFLPAPAALEPTQRKAVERFRAAGGVVVERDVERLRAAVTALPLPATLAAPARGRSFWFRAPDDSWRLALTNEPTWILDRRAAPPPPVDDARLVLHAAGWTVRDAGTGRLLELRDSPEGPTAALPAFQEGLVLRLGPSDEDLGDR